MRGTLSEGVVPGLLRELYVGRQSGHLHFSRGAERRSVRFYKGSILHGDTNVGEDRLGEMLVRQGVLSEVDLQRATEIVHREKARLGEVLIELGVLDQQQLGQALASHAREVLLKVFAWNDGEYSFEGDGPQTRSEDDAVVTLSTGEIILEAVRSVKDPDVVRYALGDIDRIVGLSNDPLLRFQKITLTPSDGYILSRVDGTLSAREVVQLAPFSADEAQSSIFGLLCTGVVEYLPLPPKTRREPPPLRSARAAPPLSSATARTPIAAAPERPVVAGLPVPLVGSGVAPPAARKEIEDRRQEILDAYQGLKTRSHFEILGITRAATEAQVKEAYFRLARRFHPDSHHDPSLIDLRDKLDAVFIRLGEAYEILRNVRTRGSYESLLASRTPRAAPPPPSTAPPAVEETDPTVDARLALESIRKAEKHLEKEEYWDAIQLLEKAIPAVEKKLKQRARVNLARAYVKNPNWVKRAEEVLQTVVQEDPKNADAYFCLGELYRQGGLKSRALTMYRKVVELKPDHEQALVQVALLVPQDPETPPESGGLLKRIFGKS